MFDNSDEYASNIFTDNIFTEEFFGNREKSEILRKFKKLIAFRSMHFLDSQLFEYLMQKYRFSSHTDIVQFRKDYRGVEGFRRFIIHFIRPDGDWENEYADLNREIKAHVIKNLGELLHYCRNKAI